MRKEVIILIFYWALINSSLIYSMDTSNTDFSAEFTQNRQVREISARITVPDPAWRIIIQEVYVLKSELWVISQLERMPGMAAQMITTIEDKISIDAPDFPIKHYVLGKTWKWKNEEGYFFLNSRNAIDDQLKMAEKIYKR